MTRPRNPYLAVDAIVETTNGSIVVIERRFEPVGFALPGGFVDYGESLEDAVRREVKEETGLNFTIEQQLKAYSDPKRDPRQHVVSVVFVGKGVGQLKAGDDAGAVRLISPYSEINMMFDHKQIILDYISEVVNERRHDYY